MNWFKPVGVGFALACVVSISGTALSQDRFALEGDRPGVMLSEASYQDLLDRVETLEASLAETNEDGWRVVSDEAWSHKVGGGISADYVMYPNQNAGSRAKVADAENYFEYRFLRLAVAGKGYGIYSYKIEFEFEPEYDGREAVMIRNMYVGVDDVPILGYVRFGNFRTPVSLEWSTPYRDLTFMERSLASIFPSAWQTGAAAFNRTDSKNLTWVYGVFFQDIDQVTKERSSDAQGTILLARATYTPFYDEPSGGRYLVHTGIGCEYIDDRDNSVIYRARPEVHENGTWIRTAAVPADHYSVVALEGAVVWGPFSLQSEYIYSDAGGFGFQGGYVYGSWFLTGENRGYRRMSGEFTNATPLENFWVVRGAGVGTGAVELAARWSFLDLSGTGHANGGTQNDLTVGLNWYWNPKFRWMLNYIHSWTAYDDGDPTAENDILGIRGQVAF